MLDKISPVWNGFADGFHYESDVSSSEDCLKKLIAFANTINHDNKAHSRQEVINRIMNRGIQFKSRLETSSDTTEFLGLIGEIITEHFVKENGGLQEFYTKWRKKGTSKSRGIDMIAIKENNESAEFFLIEAKHLHSVSGNVSNDLKKRIEEGIGEFEHEKTIQSLAGISSEISSAIATIRQVGGNVDSLEKQCDFLEERMQKNDYVLIIVACIDKTKYGNTEFKKLMKNISSETDIGKIDFLEIDVVQINALDEKTNLILGGN